MHAGVTMSSAAGSALASFRAQPLNFNPDEPSFLACSGLELRRCDGQGRPALPPQQSLTESALSGGTGLAWQCGRAAHSDVSQACRERQDQAGLRHRGAQEVKNLFVVVNIYSNNASFRSLPLNPRPQNELNPSPSNPKTIETKTRRLRA